MPDLSTPAIAPPSASELYEADLSITETDAPDPTVASNEQPVTITGEPTYDPADLSQGYDGLDENLVDFANEGLETPSRWDSDLVQEGVNLINADIEDQHSRQSASLDEFSSSRGMVGSGIEMWNKKDQLLNLERERMRRLFDLNREQANTYAADRGQAAAIATQIGNFQRGQNLDQDAQSRYMAEFERLTGRDAAADAATAFSQGLAGAQFEQNQAQFAASMSEQARQFGLELDDRSLGRLHEMQMQDEIMGLERDKLSVQEALGRLDAETREAISKGQVSADVAIQELRNEQAAATDAVRQAIAEADNTTRQNVATAENAARERMNALDAQSREQIAQWANTSREKINTDEWSARDAIAVLQAGTDQSIAALDDETRRVIAGWANNTQEAIAKGSAESRERVAAMGATASVFDAIARHAAAVGNSGTLPGRPTFSYGGGWGRVGNTSFSRSTSSPPSWLQNVANLQAMRGS